MAQDLTVYMVQQGENPAIGPLILPTWTLTMAFLPSPREEWEDSPSFDAQVKERMDHQQEREQAFLDHKGDCFAIYQVKHTDELRDIRYEGLEWIKSIGQTVHAGTIMIWSTPRRWPPAT